MSLYIRNEAGEFIPIPSIKGSDGITPHIGDNGNWFIGDTDTGKPSRGEDGGYYTPKVSFPGHNTVQFDFEPSVDGMPPVPSETITIPAGKNGVGIKSVVLNSDYTLTIRYDDDTSYTSESIRGEKGEQGDTGDTGPQGPKGDTGSNGISITHEWDGTVLKITSASGTSSTNLKGEQGIQGEKGDKGDKGDQGEQGIQGIPGEKGEKGEKGDTGTNGKDGSDASVTATNIQNALGFTPANPSALSLGIHTDGLVYLFVSGQPVGSGIQLTAAGDVVGYVDENNNIIVSGNIPDGTYSVKYEMDDGTTVDIGDLVVDNSVYYSVTNNLTQCTNSNSATEIAEGESYSATITAKSGYELKSVAVTMGGTPVTVSGGTINIVNVTGNIVITAVAEEKAVEPTYTNLLPLSVDANGNDYVGTNGEDGYKAGYKMSTSSGNESATTGAYCSGFMPITDIYSYIRVKNITLSDAANVNNFVFYDANKTKLTGSSTNGTAGAFHVSVADEGNGVYKLRPSTFVAGSIAFFRFSCGGITDETIVTVDEEITTPEITEPTNLADPTSSDWQEGYRLSISSGSTTALAGHTTTNYIPAKMGDVLCVKGMNIIGYLAGTTSDSPNAAKIVTFDASKTKLGGLYGTGSTGKNNYGNKVTQNGDISTYTILIANDDSQQATSQCAFIRIDGELMDGYTKNDVIITINEPIE